MTERTNESVQQMVDNIKKKLNMATGAAIRPDHFSSEHYDEIKDIHDMIIDRTSFSISEIEAIVSELGRIRNQT